MMLLINKKLNSTIEGLLYLDSQTNYKKYKFNHLINILTLSFVGGRWWFGSSLLGASRRHGHPTNSLQDHFQLSRHWGSCWGCRCSFCSFNRLQWGWCQLFKEATKPFPISKEHNPTSLIMSKKLFEKVPSNLTH